MSVIRVQLFAAARDLVGSDVVEVPATEPLTASQLKQRLLELYPALEPMAPALQLAVNCRFASGEQVVNPQDQVACIPPVSGG